MESGAGIVLASNPAEAAEVPVVLEESPAELVYNTVTGPLSTALGAAARACAALPSDEDFHYYKHFKRFKEPIQGFQTRIAALLQRFGSTSEWADDPEEASDWLISVVDDLLEQVDTSIDAAKRGNKPLGKEQGSTVGASVASVVSAANGEGAKVVPFHVPSIPRPQDKFEEKVDNSHQPFIFKGPFLSDEVQARLQGSDAGPADSAAPFSRLAALDSHARRLGIGSSLGPSTSHPLAPLLKDLVYPEAQLQAPEEPLEVPKGLDEVTWTLVETVKELADMAEKLSKHDELAIDLEHHHYRSFQGFVSVMQISTLDEDFVIDAISLRSHIGPVLGPLFADPAVLKIMHGADHDILWLQRDFGIYVANLFDTGQAARVLGFPSYAYVYLLDRFCKVKADKRYQLADWRLRPLPDDMIRYARMDTRYLFHIYKSLRLLLTKPPKGKKQGESSANRIPVVLARSKEVCLQLYEKEVFSETAYLKICRTSNKPLTQQQLAVLAGLYAWRDKTARNLDESPGYVLPNNLLLKLSFEMPTTVPSLHSLLKASAPLVAKHAVQVVSVIETSKEQAAGGTSAVAWEALRDWEEGLSVPEVNEVKPSQVKGVKVNSIQTKEVNVVTNDNGNQKVNAGQPKEVNRGQPSDKAVLVKRAVGSSLFGKQPKKRKAAQEENPKPTSSSEPWTLDPGTLDPTEPRILDPTEPRTLDPTEPRTLDPTEPRTLDPRPAVSPDHTLRIGVPTEGEAVKRNRPAEEVGPPRVPKVSRAAKGGLFGGVPKRGGADKVAQAAAERIKASITLPFSGLQQPAQEAHKPVPVEGQMPPEEPIEGAIDGPRGAIDGPTEAVGSPKCDQGASTSDQQQAAQDVLLFEDEDEEQEEDEGPKLGQKGEDGLPLPISAVFKHKDRRKRKEDRGAEVTEGKKQKVVESGQASSPGEFDFGAAKAAMGLSSIGKSRKESRPKNRSKKGGEKPEISGVDTEDFFDPMRSARGPEGKSDLKAGKRSQAFPRSGNRTLAFKR